MRVCPQTCWQPYSTLFLYFQQINRIHLAAWSSCSGGRFGAPMEQKDARQAPIRTNLHELQWLPSFAWNTSVHGDKVLLWENVLLAFRLCPDIERMHSFVLFCFLMDCVILNFWPWLLIRVYDELAKRKLSLVTGILHWQRTERSLEFFLFYLSQENHTFEATISNNDINNYILFLWRLQSNIFKLVPINILELGILWFITVWVKDYM